MQHIGLYVKKPFQSEKISNNSSEIKTNPKSDFCQTETPTRYINPKYAGSNAILLPDNMAKLLCVLFHARLKRYRTSMGYRSIALMIGKCRMTAIRWVDKAYRLGLISKSVAKLPGTYMNEVNVYELHPSLRGNTFLLNRLYKLMPTMQSMGLEIQLLQSVKSWLLGDVTLISIKRREILKDSLSKIVRRAKNYKILPPFPLPIFTLPFKTTLYQKFMLSAVSSASLEHAISLYFQFRSKISNPIGWIIVTAKKHSTKAGLRTNQHYADKLAEAFGVSRQKQEVNGSNTIYKNGTQCTV